MKKSGIQQKNFIDEIDNYTNNDSVIEPYFFVIIVLLIILTLFSNHIVFERIGVQQTSMVPTIIDGGEVIVHKTKLIKRGDIIVFSREVAPDILLVKRVVAVGGDKIKINENGITTITDGRTGEMDVFEEDYINNGNNIVIEEITIPYGYIYVLGDNRLASFDSSEFGSIKVDRIYGRVIEIKDKVSWRENLIRSWPYNR